MLEMSLPKLRRFDRPISVSAVPAGPSIDIWRSCRLLGAMLRALGGLPGGLGGFLPCRLGANHCRLWSVGWERCGHGVTSRPLEASDSGFLDDFLFLFGYPSGSGESLDDGSPWMRYCSTNFPIRSPTWKLQPSGGVAALVAAVGVPPLEAGLRGSGAAPNVGDFEESGRRKRIRPTTKTDVRKTF